jgi:hypothetical protein
MPEPDFDEVDIERVRMGGHLDQMKSVQAAESLQDYHRDREGHLMIRDDRPFLIMSFGTKYQGPNSQKYMVEGKYHIPEGYKSIVKWDDDEVVFMTRRGVFGPEYQILYLPKSAVADDFTLFEWNANLEEIWDQLLTVLETQEGKDMEMWEKGPWYTFGITEETVQIAVEQGAGEAAVVEGIMTCMEGTHPSFHEYAQYLGFLSDSDDNFQWIVNEFMTEHLPPQWGEYIADQMMYWVETSKPGGESTWKHPLYDKYNLMLKVARQKRPVPHWRTIMTFQIDFLFQQLFTWENEMSGEYPPVETVENVKEMARIFKVDVETEPYLAHVLKRSLRHYAGIVKTKKPIGEIDDFRSLMQRYRDLVGQFERAKKVEEEQTGDVILCIECAEGKKKVAVLYCDVCQDMFCQVCFDRLHSKGRRQDHKRTWTELGTCIECEGRMAVFHCVQCQDAFCKECFEEWHVRGGRRNHTPIVLRRFNLDAQKMPSTGTFRDGRLSCAAITIGSSAARNLAKALSPWLAFEDETQIKIYYNMQTGDSRRDAPGMINEPVEDILGGGFAGAWSGSYIALENEFSHQDKAAAA